MSRLRRIVNWLFRPKNDWASPHLTEADTDTLNEYLEADSGSEPEAESEADTDT